MSHDWVRDGLRGTSTCADCGETRDDLVAATEVGASSCPGSYTSSCPGSHATLSAIQTTLRELALAPPSPLVYIAKSDAEEELGYRLFPGATIARSRFAPTYGEGNRPIPLNVPLVALLPTELTRLELEAAEREAAPILAAAGSIVTITDGDGRSYAFEYTGGTFDPLPPDRKEWSGAAPFAGWCVALEMEEMRRAIDELHEAFEAMLRAPHPSYYSFISTYVSTGARRVTARAAERERARREVLAARSRRPHRPRRRARVVPAR